MVFNAPPFRAVAIVYLVGLVALAGGFVYLPSVIDIIQVQPPLTFSIVDVSGTTGPNQTSAIVNITLSKTNIQLITNPGYDTGADSWYYTTSDSLLGAGWVSTDNLADGIIVIYNTTDVSSITDSTLYLYQNFTVQEPITSVTVAVRYRLASQPYFYTAYYGSFIYNWSDGSSTTLISQTPVSVSNSYTTDTATVSVDLNPGYTYAFVVYSRLTQIVAWINNNFYFLIDYANLTYSPSNYTYNGVVLGLSSNQSVQARLVITGISVTNGTPYIIISLANDTESSSIAISGTSANRTTTDWVSIPPSSSSIYYEGRITVYVTSSDPVEAQIELLLEYQVGGVRVWYPITLNITTP